MIPWLPLSSLASGAAAAWATVVVLDAVSQLGDMEGPTARMEEERRRRLRAASPFYRRAEPIIRSWSQRQVGPLSRLAPWVGRSLRAAGESDWTASEYLAAQQLRGAAMALVVGLLVMQSKDSLFAGLVYGVFTLGAWLGGSLWGLRGRANRRRAAIAARLPYAVDLIALILESGGHLLDAIATILRDMEQHPLAEELAHVHRAIRLGLPHDEALQAMNERVGLPAVNDLVNTIIQGERGGTPLAEIFRVQAEQLRIRRSQDIEKAAAKANVHMVYPALISMLACLLVMASQFLIWLMSSR